MRRPAKPAEHSVSPCPDSYQDFFVTFFGSPKESFGQDKESKRPASSQYDQSSLWRQQSFSTVSLYLTLKLPRDEYFGSCVVHYFYIGVMHE